MHTATTHKLLRFATIFYCLATGEELPSNSNDLDTVLHNLERIETYTARKKYAESNLEHLSSGSSRIVYLTTNKTIIKLAKNDRGIARNKAEANPDMKSKYLNKSLRCASNYAWVEVPYLEKITEKQFQQMTGLHFDDFGEALRFGLRDVSGNSDKEKPEHFEEVSRSDIFKELKNIGERLHLMPGDMARISSWGCKDGKPVLIDSGLTKSVYNEFYEDSDKTT